MLKPVVLASMLCGTLAAAPLHDPAVSADPLQLSGSMFVPELRRGEVCVLGRGKTWPPGTRPWRGFCSLEFRSAGKVAIPAGDVIREADYQIKDGSIFIENHSTGGSFRMHLSKDGKHLIHDEEILPGPPARSRSKRGLRYRRVGSELVGATFAPVLAPDEVCGSPGRPLEPEKRRSRAYCRISFTDNKTVELASSGAAERHPYSLQGCEITVFRSTPDVEGRITFKLVLNSEERSMLEVTATVEDAHGFGEPSSRITQRYTRLTP